MCLVCKKDKEMETLSFSNDITINESYDMSDDLEYCTYCGAIFLKSYKLGKNNEEDERNG